MLLSPFMPLYGKYSLEFAILTCNTDEMCLALSVQAMKDNFNADVKWYFAF
jgi:hypothetical protein